MVALAGVGLFFTHKSRAAAFRACNAMIRNGQWLPSDVFDSHHPLHPPPRQPAEAIVKRLAECCSQRDVGQLAANCGHSWCEHGFPLSGRRATLSTLQKSIRTYST